MWYVGLYKFPVNTAKTEEEEDSISRPASAADKAEDGDKEGEEGKEGDATQPPQTTKDGTQVSIAKPGVGESPTGLMWQAVVYTHTHMRPYTVCYLVI